MVFLQESCPGSTFLHLPFFFDPLVVPEDATPPEERHTDVFLYGSTWSPPLSCFPYFIPHVRGILLSEVFPKIGSCLMST
jgi:hypothetical protein